MKKWFISVVWMFASSMGMAQSLNLDLTSTADIASGAYDLDLRYNGFSAWGKGNVAGIYQVNAEMPQANTEDPETNSVKPGWANMAEIQQFEGVNNLAMIWQQGYNNETHIYQIHGENNQARLAQMGTGNYASLMHSRGSDNVMMVQMLGDGSRITASQTEATNSLLSVVLNTGSNLNVTQTGRGNSFSVDLAPGLSMVVNQTGK